MIIATKYTFGEAFAMYRRVMLPWTSKKSSKESGQKLDLQRIRINRTGHSLSVQRYKIRAGPSIFLIPMQRPKYIVFDYTKMDKLIHNRLRLSMLSSIAYSEEIDFSSLKNTVKATDGNLGRQIQILEESGYISSHTRFSKHRPQKMVSLTKKGRNALMRYKKHVMALLQFQDTM